MKFRAGVNAGTGTVVTVEATVVHVHEITMASKTGCKKDTVVYGDSGYPGIEMGTGIVTDEHLSAIDYRVNFRPGKLCRMKDNGGQNWERFIDRCKPSVRSKAEHPFPQCAMWFSQDCLSRALDELQSRVCVACMQQPVFDGESRTPFCSRSGLIREKFA